MALAKLSLPGWVNLSPVCNPAIESTMAVSRCLMPVIPISAIIYSLGILAFCHSSSLGSTEVGLEVSSCACAASTDTTAVIIIAQIRDKNRCMVVCSNQSENSLLFTNGCGAFDLLRAVNKVLKGRN